MYINMFGRGNCQEHFFGPDLRGLSKPLFRDFDLRPKTFYIRNKPISLKLYGDDKVTGGFLLHQNSIFVSRNIRAGWKSAWIPVCTGMTLKGHGNDVINAHVIGIEIAASYLSI